ncbi:hypothetical protein RZE82_03125 [Mollicutes bacterium LVI A0039]|nr:hypothetical protein RZE82_03125 [Mollicutes bacterium LVI A0039]
MKISKINDLDLLVSEIETVSIRDQIEVHLNQFELKSYIKVFGEGKFYDLKSPI